jgi:hypothetical protein
VGEGGGGGDGERPRGEGLCRPARASAAPSPRGAGRTGAGTAAWPSLVVGGRERGVGSLGEIIIIYLEHFAVE